jgi:pimeloyl-ACP methyl ester carboxylesterase
MKKLLVAALIALLLIAGLTPTAYATEIDAADCSTQSTAVPSSLTERPVIFVHGWMGSAAGSGQTVTALDEKLGAGYKAFAFDYSTANRVWGASGGTKTCLAGYLLAASKAFQNGGGDGKVLAVGHSMGGIVIRAASGVLAASGGGDRLAGVVTIGTPLLGSPWGGTAFAEFLQWASNKLSVGHDALQMPAEDSSAITCLAAPLPGNCDSFPYLPEGTKYAAVGSQITIQRQLFGLDFMPADIPLFGDSIVPKLSATGYVNSSAGPLPKGGFVGEKVLECKHTSGYLSQRLLNVRTSWGIPATLTATLVGTIVEELADQRALDTMMAGKADLAQFPLVLQGLVSPCSHTSLPTYGPAIEATAGYLKQMAAAATGSGAPAATDGGGGWIPLSAVEPSFWGNGFSGYKPLTIKNTRFPESIKASWLTGPYYGEPDHSGWALKGKCTKLEVWVGQDADSPGHAGKGSFTVTLDDRVAAKEVMTYLDAARKITLDLTGVTIMEFQDQRTNVGGAYNVWGSPRILCSANPTPKKE